MLHTDPLTCEVHCESTLDSMMSVTHKPSRVALCFSFTITVGLELPPSSPLPMNLHSNPASWKVCTICITNHAELEADCECWADMWCPVCSGNLDHLACNHPLPTGFYTHRARKQSVASGHRRVHHIRRINVSNISAFKQSRPSKSKLTTT